MAQTQHITAAKQEAKIGVRKTLKNWGGKKVSKWLQSSISQAVLGHIPWLLTPFNSVLAILARFVLAGALPRAVAGPTVLLDQEPCHGATRHPSLL